MEFLIAVGFMLHKNLLFLIYVSKVIFTSVSSDICKYLSSNWNWWHHEAERIINELKMFMLQAWNQKVCYHNADIWSNQMNQTLF